MTRVWHCICEVCPNIQAHTWTPSRSELQVHSVMTIRMWSSLFLFLISCHLNSAIHMKQVLPPGVKSRGPGAYHVLAHSGNVTAVAGRTATLNCRVDQLNNVTLSWLRRGSVPILLSVGTYLYTMDSRVSVHRDAAVGDWKLLVRNVTSSDSGHYDCQIGSTPPLSHLVTLSVVKPQSYIEGGAVMYIHANSLINLTCVVKNPTQPSATIHWLHNGQVIGYNSSRGGVSMVTTLGDTSVAQLLLTAARTSDSGAYTCVPRGVHVAHTHVHIINGKRPEAMQSSSGYGLKQLDSTLIVLALNIGLTVR